MYCMLLFYKTTFMLNVVKIIFLHFIFVCHLSNALYSLISTCLHLELFNLDYFAPSVQFCLVFYKIEWQLSNLEKLKGKYGENWGLKLRIKGKSTPLPQFVNLGYEQWPKH